MLLVDKDSANKDPQKEIVLCKGTKRPPIIQRAKEDPLRRGVNIVPNISVGWFIPSILCNLVASFSKINGLTSSIFATKNDIVTDHHFIERLKKY